MQITRESDYAVRCVLYLACHKGETSVVGDIAAEQGIPKTFTAKILQKLVKAGIIDSTRGIKGGFTLAKAPSMITLLDVIEAVQGPVALNICVIDRKGCKRIDICSVHPVWIELRSDLVKKLRLINFRSLTRSSKSLSKASSKRRLK